MTELDHLTGWALALLRARGPLERHAHTWADGVTRTAWVWTTSSGNAFGFGDDIAAVLIDAGYAKRDAAADALCVTPAGAEAALPAIAPAMPPPTRPPPQKGALL